MTALLAVGAWLYRLRCGAGGVALALHAPLAAAPRRENAPERKLRPSCLDRPLGTLLASLRDRLGVWDVCDDDLCEVAGYISPGTYRTVRTGYGIIVPFMANRGPVTGKMPTSTIHFSYPCLLWPT